MPELLQLKNHTTQEQDFSFYVTGLINNNAGKFGRKNTKKQQWQNAA